MKYIIKKLLLLGIISIVTGCNSSSQSNQKQQSEPVYVKDGKMDSHSKQIMGIIEKNNNGITVVTNWLSRSRISYSVDKEAAKELEGHVGDFALLIGEIIGNESNPWTVKIIVHEIVEINPKPIE